MKHSEVMHCHLSSSLLCIIVILVLATTTVDDNITHRQEARLASISGNFSSTRRRAPGAEEDVRVMAGTTASFTHSTRIGHDQEEGTPPTTEATSKYLGVVSSRSPTKGKGVVLFPTIVMALASPLVRYKHFSSTSISQTNAYNQCRDQEMYLGVVQSPADLAKLKVDVGHPYPWAANGFAWLGGTDAPTYDNGELLPTLSLTLGVFPDTRSGNQHVTKVMNIGTLPTATVARKLTFTYKYLCGYTSAIGSGTGPTLKLTVGVSATQVWSRQIDLTNGGDYSYDSAHGGSPTNYSPLQTATFDVPANLAGATKFTMQGTDRNIHVVGSGIKDAVEGTWLWSRGSPRTMHDTISHEATCKQAECYWQSGEPNNGGGGIQHHLAMKKDGTWYDAKDASTIVHAYICEFPLTPTETMTTFTPDAIIPWNIETSLVPTPPNRF